MRRLVVTATALLALLAVAAAPASAARKKAPKKPVYEFAGGYSKTSVVFTRCNIVTGGTVSNTTRVVRTYAYSGDTKSGVTIVETEQTFLIRDAEDSEYIKDSTAQTSPQTTQRTSKGSEVITRAKGNTGTFQFDGIGSDLQRQTFKLPRKKGQITEIKIASSSHSDDPGRPADCDVSYDTSEAKGIVFVRMKR